MDSHENRPTDIRARAFAFSVRVVRLCKYLGQETMAHRNLIDQLVRSGTSIGANLEEATGAQSPADFVHKNNIALKGSRETKYWLRLIAATETIDPAAQQGLAELVDECDQIARIVGKIVVTARGRGRIQE